ncbi:conserved hypothetical protein [Edwardsiella phage PEi26]|uniref:Phospholipase n=1 Tax=Edwardsiella phage PEi26 TaxID=1608311 RepID=A0A0B6VPE3_9CAUD|nr:conserved hypothetical protein [Edwardsiella phage PEi26]
MAGLSFDKCVTAGHSSYPPTQVNATQGKVFTGGITVLVDGDQITPHTKTSKPYDTHGGSIQPRTSKVYVTGKKAVQMADPISCGDTVAQSSSKVFIH